MKKNARAVSVISGVDGPTSVFIAKKPLKLTLRQKLERRKHQIKRKYVEKTLKGGSHSMDEVSEYIVNEYGFVEVNHDSDEIAEEYKQMRASFMIQYAPELLGEYAVLPELKSESTEDIELYIRQSEERMKRAMEIPQTVFDIDFHKYKKVFDNINDRMDIIIEKKYGYIGGGASGNKKLVKKYNCIYKDVCRYYGVTEDDIKNKSERYKDLVRTLSL
ncbi:MAG: hypothetical protein ACI4ES_04595 [Roseburia sp.]